MDADVFEKCLLAHADITQKIIEENNTDPDFDLNPMYWVGFELPGGEVGLVPMPDFIDELPPEQATETLRKVCATQSFPEGMRTFTNREGGDPLVAIHETIDVVLSVTSGWTLDVETKERIGEQFMVYIESREGQQGLVVWDIERREGQPPLVTRRADSPLYTQLDPHPDRHGRMQNYFGLTPEPEKELVN